MMQPKPDQILADRVRAHIPDADGDQLLHRVMLLRAFDHAAVLRGNTTSWLAHDCAGRVIDIAGQFALRCGESLCRLEEAARLARGLLAAAMRAETLNDPETPL